MKHYPIALLLKLTFSKGLVLKIKDGYKIELQEPETMKLFCNKKNNRQNKE